MTKSGFDLDEIERLLAAATPGEWVTGCGFERNYLYGGGAHLACIGGSEDYEINDDGSPNEADNNAALIVAARNSFPALLTEIRELRAENARLKKLTSPTWFYHPEYPEYCRFAPTEVIDEDYDPEPGDYVLEIDCAVALPSIWCAVHVSGDPDDDERFTYTEHASEAEARAALGEPQ